VGKVWLRNYLSRSFAIIAETEHVLAGLQVVRDTELVVKCHVVEPFT
jgi:hypothetical protein